MASDEDAQGAEVRGALDSDAAIPFGARSIVRSVVAEPVTALLIQRVLVMDVAHPKVAAAVHDHSTFRTTPNLRAWSTADAAIRLVFGDAAVAQGAARQIYKVHDRIEGEAAPVGDGSPSGRRYSAHDAALLTWVWATLVDSAELAFTRWVRPFTHEEGEDYYREMVGFARFFGIPAQSLPSDRAEFSSYMEAMYVSGLEVDHQSREMARHILWFSHWRVPPPAVKVQRLLALRTLDTRLLDMLDIRLTRRDEQAAERLDRWLTTFYRHLPGVRRSGPLLYLALRRPTIGLSARVRALRSADHPSGRL